MNTAHKVRRVIGGLFADPGRSDLIPSDDEKSNPESLGERGYKGGEPPAACLALPLGPAPDFTTSREHAEPHFVFCDGRRTTAGAAFRRFSHAQAQCSWINLGCIHR